MTTTPGTPVTPGADGAYTCPYCRTTTVMTADTTSCAACGSATDVQRVRSSSGWVKQPPIADMARLRFGRSSAQITGTYVPVTELSLAEGDAIYFSHHVLLHADTQVRLANMPMKGGWKRMMGGLPLFMLTATGPGHVALSLDHPGETIAVPLQAGQVIDVVEHRMLAATGNIGYDWTSSDIWVETRNGDEREWSYPIGQFIDRFGANQVPGLLLLHAPGNVMVRDLAPGEEVVVQPRALVYKDPTVPMSLHFEYPNGGNMFNNAMHQWLRLRGPGRIAIASVFEQPERLTGRVVGTSWGTTTQRW